MQPCATCTAPSLKRDTTEGLEREVAEIYACRMCKSRWKRGDDGVRLLEKVWAYRCPRCGSENAFCDESSSFVDISCMRCRACGNESFCDSWQRDEWIAEVERPVGAPNEFDV